MKLLSLLFLAPLAGIFFVAYQNNIDDSLQAVFYVYVNIITRSLGFPVLMIAAVILYWKGNVKGLKMIKIMSALLFSFWFLMIIANYVMPEEVLCSDTNGNCPKVSFIKDFIYLILPAIIYGLNFWHSNKVIKETE